MADKWIPDDLLFYAPTWVNFFENPTTVQFDHRVLGITTVTNCALLWLRCMKAGPSLPPRAKIAANVLIGVACAQVCVRGVR